MSVLFLLIIACTSPESQPSDPQKNSTDDTGHTENGLVDTGLDTDSIDTADTMDTAVSDTEDSSNEDTSEPAEIPDCYSYSSNEEDYAPVQTVGAPMPSVALAKEWLMPVTYTSFAAFSGNTGSPANHEGLDYIHGDQSSAVISVFAASEGRVVYVRTGCPQDSMFSPNEMLRECGSGWGNHIVLDHGDGIFSRYGHLAPNSIDVLVGDWIALGDRIAEMGNTGRSQLRHLHFELGAKNTAFAPCLASQSMDLVYDPSVIPELNP